MYSSRVARDRIWHERGGIPACCNVLVTADSACRGGTMRFHRGFPGLCGCGCVTYRLSCAGVRLVYSDADLPHDDDRG